MTVTHLLTQKTLAIALTALILGGCGVGPYEETPPAAGLEAEGYRPNSAGGYDAEAPTRAQAGPPPSAQRLFDSGLKVDRHAEQAAAAYGLAYGNWSWQTYYAQHSAMARLATGALRRNLLSNKPDRRVIRALGSNEQMNTAYLVATDTVDSTSASRTVVLVMRERSIENGLSDPAPRHTVYRARLSLTQDGWRLSDWDLLPT